MGIFYGQGWAAFIKKDNDVFKLIHPDGVPCEDRAKLFHRCITDSFGAPMKNLRRKIREYGYDFDMKEAKIFSPVEYYMPDGMLLARNPREKVNALGELDGPKLDVRVSSGLWTTTFKKVQFTLSSYALGEDVRKGFVNLIHSVDALLARLIIHKLGELGASHVIGIHDCFRVSINDMHLLEEAVKWAYLALFSSDQDGKSDLLPKGMDIMNLYFQGMNRVLKDEFKIPEGKLPSQFYGPSKIRRLKPIDGYHIKDLINALGTTYYFSK
jgi:hypothetical protein